MDFNRDAAAIAKDIARRFLPKYREQFAAQLVRKASTEKYHSDKKSLAQGLAKTLGESVSGHSESTIYFYNHCSGELQITGGDSVEAKLRSLTKDQAEQLVGAYQHLKRGVNMTNRSSSATKRILP